MVYVPLTHHCGAGPEPPCGEVMPDGQAVVLKVEITSKVPPYMATLPQLLRFICLQKGDRLGVLAQMEFWMPMEPQVCVRGWRGKVSGRFQR